MNIYYFLGVVGATFILIGFLLRGNKRFGVGTVFFEVLNLFGSLFLVLYALDGKVWPFVVLNAVWLANSLWVLSKKWFCRS